VPFLLSSQSPCIYADGKILMLIGAQIDEENPDDLDIGASAPSQVWSHLVKGSKRTVVETLLLDTHQAPVV